MLGSLLLLKAVFIAIRITSRLPTCTVAIRPAPHRPTSGGAGAGGDPRQERSHRRPVKERSTNRQRRDGGDAEMERGRAIPGESGCGEEGVGLDNGEGMEGTRHRVDGRVQTGERRGGSGVRVE